MRNHYLQKKTVVSVADYGATIMYYSPNKLILCYEL